MVPQPELDRPGSIADLAARLIDLGYHPVPIPSGCKGPILPGWQNMRIKAEDVGRYWNEAGMLVGCLHTNLACFDIDVYDPELSAQIVAEAMRRFPGALERIGRAPKSAIVLRMEEPGFRIHNTEKLSRAVGGEQMEAQVEVRTVTRQMVVYGIHPETGQRYTWPRGELWATPRDELPELTREAAHDFRDWCNETIRKWAGQGLVIDLGQHRSAPTSERISEQAFIEALRHVPPSLGHEEGWRDVLMGIHDYFGGSMRGLEIAKDWSSPDPRYSAYEVETKWRSFEAGKGVSYRTVLHLAKQHGCNLGEIDRFARDEAYVEMSEAEKAEIPPALFRPWRAIDLTTIPHPEFVYSDFYARGYTSVTLAAPKVGKSMLGLAEAIDMATGRGFLTGVQRDPLRVVYYNAEDDQGVLDSRVAALLTHYDIDQSEIEGRLFPTSGVDMPEFFMISGQEGVINEALFVSIEKFCEAERADVLLFDPLQDLSRSPETNEVFRLLGQRLRRLASNTGVSLGLIHHTRKVTPGLTPTIDDGRGGSALRGTARFNRILVGMSEDEAVKAGVPNHRHYFRVGDMESNLAPPSADVNRWFEKVSVLTPNGHSVGAVAPWKWPDAFQGVTVQDARRIQRAIASAPEPPKASPQSAQWVGLIVAAEMGLDADSKSVRARINAILKTWIEADVLRLDRVFSKRDGREIPVVTVGANTMSDGE